MTILCSDGIQVLDEDMMVGREVQDHKVVSMIEYVMSKLY
jgi:hypothetical protein